MVIDDEDIEIPGYGLTSAAVHIQYRYPVSALLGEVRLNALLRMSRSMVRPTWVQKEVTCSEQQMSKFRLFKKGRSAKIVARIVNNLVNLQDGSSPAIRMPA